MENEKHNHSNDPTSKQPTLPDGTFTFKDGTDKTVTNESESNENHDEDDIDLSELEGIDEFIDMSELEGIDEFLDSGGEIKIEDIPKVSPNHDEFLAKTIEYAEQKGGLSSKEANEIVKKCEGNDLACAELLFTLKNKGLLKSKVFTEGDKTFVIPNITTEGYDEFEKVALEYAKQKGGMTGDEVFSFLVECGGMSYDASDFFKALKKENLLKPDEYDENEQPSEGTVSEYDKKIKEHEAEIKEAEKQLGGEKEILYNSYKDQYGFDATLINKASDEEINALNEAISIINGKVPNAVDYEFENEVMSTQNVLSNTFKNFKYNFKIENYPEIKDSIDSKISYYEDLLKTAQESEDEYGIKKYQSRIDALKKLPDLYDKYMSKKQFQKDYEEQLKGAEELISKYQDPYDMYSVARHQKAKLATSTEEGEELFSKEAEKQWASLSNGERESILQYTGNGYRSMNYPLRGRDNPYGLTSADALKRMQQLTSALDKCRLDRDSTLIRRVGPHMMFGNISGEELTKNINNPEFLSKMVGIEYVDNAVQSCSSNSGAMDDWNGIDVQLYLPKGTKAFYVRNHSYYKGEDEVILGRGYHMVVREAYYDYVLARPVVKVDVILGSDKDRLTDSQMKELYEKHLHY